MAHKQYGTKQGSSRQGKNSVPLYLLAGALLLIIVGVFVLLRGTPTPSKSVEVAGKPKLAVDREQIDFGKVPLDKAVRAEFELSNVGDQPLELVGIPQVEVREGC
jgi:hypothetical protein